VAGPDDHGGTPPVASLDANLSARLELLESTGVVRPEVAAQAALAATWIEELGRFRLDAASGSFLVTHLAMALERSATQEELEPIEVPEADRARMEPAFEVADALLGRLEAAGWSLPAYERTMIALHLTTAWNAAALSRAEGRDVP